MLQLLGGKVKTIKTTFTHKYDIRFIIDDTDDMARFYEMDISSYDRIFIVIDENVADLYSENIIHKFEAFNKPIYIHKIQANERAKSIEYYPEMVGFFEENNAGRYDAVIAIGGGVVVDLVSFTCSTYMRGLHLFVIATTLIAQIDATTAGKTCLNTLNAKNLLGTYYYPHIVYNNIQYLKNNPNRIFRQGLSEVLKYGLLCNPQLVNKVIEYKKEVSNQSLLTEIVYLSILARIRVRKIHPLASNLGHTFGHAIEKYYNYQILHGDAISIGMILSFYFSVSEGLMSSEICQDIINIMRKVQLNTWMSDEIDTKRLIDLMHKDKKSNSRKLNLVLLKKIGFPYSGESPFYEVDYNIVQRFLSGFMDNYPFRVKNYIDFLKKDYLL